MEEICQPSVISPIPSRSTWKWGFGYLTQVEDLPFRTQFRLIPFLGFPDWRLSVNHQTSTLPFLRFLIWLKFDRDHNLITYLILQSPLWNTENQSKVFFSQCRLAIKCYRQCTVQGFYQDCSWFLPSTWFCFLFLSLKDVECLVALHLHSLHIALKWNGKHETTLLSSPVPFILFVLPVFFPIL